MTAFSALSVPRAGTAQGVANCGCQSLLLLVLVIATAIAFDFTNGFHDTGNAMATSIATGALKPKSAVTLSAVLNLIGAFLSPWRWR